MPWSQRRRSLARDRFRIRASRGLHVRNDRGYVGIRHLLLGECRHRAKAGADLRRDEELRQRLVVCGGAESCFTAGVAPIAHGHPDVSPVRDARIVDRDRAFDRLAAARGTTADGKRAEQSQDGRRPNESSSDHSRVIFHITPVPRTGFGPFAVIVMTPKSAT